MVCGFRWLRASRGTRRQWLGGTRLLWLRVEHGEGYTFGTRRFRGLSSLLPSCGTRRRQHLGGPSREFGQFHRTISPRRPKEKNGMALARWAYTQHARAKRCVRCTLLAKNDILFFGRCVRDSSRRQGTGHDFFIGPVLRFLCRMPNSALRAEPCTCHDPDPAPRRRIRTPVLYTMLYGRLWGGVLYCSMFYYR